MAVSRASCRGRVLWRPHMPHPMLAMPYHAISPPWSSSKCRNTPSTNQLRVFAFQGGRSVWLNKDYCLNTSSSSKIFGQSGNAWNLFDFYNQSAAIVCANTIKYYSIPNVPSRFEGVKTRPQNGHKQLGMERTTTSSLVPFHSNSFNPGQNKFRHALISLYMQATGKLFDVHC